MKRNLSIVGSLVLAALMPFGAQAQNTAKKDTTVTRTVVVEQEYNPDIMDASKVNVLPKVEAPTVSKKPVEYATKFFPATAIPAGLMNPYTGIETQPASKPGYVRAGYGNYGNLDLLANYLFHISDKDKLNARIQMDGMDGKLTVSEEEAKWRAFYYRTRANIDYTHQFNQMDLNIGGNFGLSNFNFRPNSIYNKQKFTSGDIYTQLNFTNETSPLQFSAATSLLMYERQHNIIEYTPGSSLKETIWRINGNVSGAINEEQRITLALTMNNFWYNGGNISNTTTDEQHFKNYSALNLNPYYELNSDDWKLHAGANVDLSFGFDQSVRISPDITAQYNFSDSYIAYAKATGGKIVNDFRRLEEVNLYSELPRGLATPSDGEPFGYTYRPYDTYEQLNATIGLKASPYPGLWFNVFGGYQNLKNDLLYTSSITPLADNYEYFMSFDQANTNNSYIGADVSYDYKEFLSFAAKYIYRGWNTSDEFNYLLFSKPESELTFNVNVRPISALSLNLGYNYTSRKKIDGIEKMSPISDLYIGASYNIYKGISVYARVNNLLNKKYQYYAGYPTEGFNFLGGLSFQF